MHVKSGVSDKYFLGIAAAFGMPENIYLEPQPWMPRETRPKSGSQTQPRETREERIEDCLVMVKGLQSWEPDGVQHF